MNNYFIGVIVVRMRSLKATIHEEIVKSRFPHTSPYKNRQLFINTSSRVLFLCYFAGVA